MRESNIKCVTGSQESSAYGEEEAGTAMICVSDWEATMRELIVCIECMQLVFHEAMVQV